LYSKTITINKQLKQLEIMKTKNTYALLALFLGGFGLHKFYVGQIGKGILYLIFAPISAVLGFFQGIYWLLSSTESFDNKYNKQRIQREILKQVEIRWIN
jgi:TM2 domain-containing membrane protein YozV